MNSLKKKSSSVLKVASSHVSLVITFNIRAHDQESNGCNTFVVHCTFKLLLSGGADKLLIKTGLKLNIFPYSPAGCSKSKSSSFINRLKPSGFLCRSNLRVNTHYSYMKVCREFGSSRFQKPES